MVRDLANELRLLSAGGMIDAALEYAAAVAMRPHSHAAIANRCKDELGISQ